jgi:tetratricopeptide (TPR) repeat protein
MTTHFISSKFGIFTFILVAACFTSATFGQLTSAGPPPPAKASPKAQPTPTIDPLSINDPNELVQAALKFYEQNKYGEALANAMKAAPLAPNDFRPPYIIGLAYWRQHKLKSASEYLAKSLALKPIKEVYLQKAKVDQYRNANEEAIVACREAVKIDPTYTEAYLTIGEILQYNDKRRDEGIAALRTVIKIDPNYLAAYESLGDALVDAKDQKGAEEIFRKAMEIDPQRMAGRFSLGRMLVEQGRLKEARELWDGRTSDEDKTFPNFIDVLKRAENLKAAQEAIAQKPNDPDTLIQMGFAIMEGDSWVVDGRQDKAIVYFRKALAIDPKLARAQYGICKAYIEIADTYKEKNKNVDAELVKLRKMDPKLANEMTQYRKTYQGGITGSSISVDQ